jgi:hypothetical protein
MCSQIQIWSKYVQPLRFKLGCALLHPSHSCWYNQARVADHQLYCAMFSQGSRSCGRTIHETVFPEASGNRNCATMCHSHTRAYLSMTLFGAWGGHMLKRCRNQAELTPEVFFSFFPSSGSGGQWLAPPYPSSSMALPCPSQPDHPSEGPKWTRRLSAAQTSLQKAGGSYGSPDVICRQRPWGGDHPCPRG